MRCLSPVRGPTGGVYASVKRRFLSLPFILLVLLAVAEVAASDVLLATEDQFLKASDVRAYSYFGDDVDISGDLAVVGAPQAGPNQTGAAYVFNRVESNWANAVKLVPADAVIGDRFGDSVAIDGDVMVVGAPQVYPIAKPGYAVVFRYKDSAWTEVETLTAPFPMNYDQFGLDVAISGNLIVVGARLDDNSSGTNAGSVFVYRRRRSGWFGMTETFRLQAPDGAAHDEFGYSVAFDGLTLVVGTNADAAYVFEWDGSGWASQAKLTASSPPPPPRPLYMGRAVSVSGNRIALGAELDSTIATIAGAVYLYDRPPGGWVDMTETVQLRASNGQAQDLFGAAVDLSGDVLLVGAPARGCCGNWYFGAAYAYSYHGAEWHESIEFVQAGGEAGDRWGGAMAIDAGTAFVTASNYRTERYAQAGAASVFAQPVPEPDITVLHGVVLAALIVLARSRRAGVFP